MKEYYVLVAGVRQGGGALYRTKRLMVLFGFLLLLSLFGGTTEQLRLDYIVHW